MNKNKHLILVLTIVCVFFSCKSNRPKSKQVYPDNPEQVVKQYLEQSVSGDLSKIRHLVSFRCFKTPVGRVESTRTFGVRLDLKSVKVKLVEKNETQAEVSYTVKGDLVTKKPPLTEINIVGKSMPAQNASAQIQGIEKKGTHILIKSNNKWKVSCKQLKK